MPNQVRIGVGVTGAKESASELDKLKDKFSKLQKQGAQGFAIGASAAITAKGLDLLAGAASDAVGFVGDLVHAGIQEEESLARLQASLRANVKGWDGNLEVINKTITAHDRLGFSEDEQRSSLTRLLAATHDVSQAFAVQQVAMDLARFKGISLGDATEALTKVEAGSYRILKSLGIALKEGATQTEALAAVEKVANGQAEAYATTTGGKLAAAQVKLDAAMEHLGEVTLPLVAAGAEIVASSLDGVDQAGKDLGGRAAGYGKHVERALTGMDAHAGKVADDFDLSTKRMSAGLDSVGTSAEEAASAARISFNRTVTAADRARDALLTDAQDTVENYFGVLITQDKLLDTQAEISKNKRILASATATKAEKHDAREALHQLGLDEATYLQDLAKAGASGSKVFTTAMADLLTRLKHAHGAERKEILAEIAALQILAAKAYAARQATLPYGSGGNLGSYGGGRAGGGPVVAGKTYDVGESGREKLTMFPGGGGMVTPEGSGSAPSTSAPSSGGGSSSGGWNGGAIPIPVPSTWSPAMQQQFARDAAPAMIRELRRQGIL